MIDGEISGALRRQLRRLGNEYGPLGVALAAASLTDKHAVVRDLTSSWADPERSSSTPVADPLWDEPQQPRPDAKWVIDHLPPLTWDVTIWRADAQGYEDGRIDQANVTNLVDAILRVVLP